MDTTSPHSLPLDRGWSWWKSGLTVFLRSPLTWIGITIIMFVIFLLLAFIPFLGSIVNQIIAPVFLGGLMIACNESIEGRDVKLNHLFAGFSRNTGQLLTLGAIYLAAMLLIFTVLTVIMFLIPGGQEAIADLQSGETATLRSSLQFLLIIMLIGMALYLPLLMAYWFAPALIIFNDMGALKAMSSSFKACLFNILPFTLYGIIGLILSIIAAIPFGLGFLVLTPLVIVTIYVAYDEIFSPPAV